MGSGPLRGGRAPRLYERSAIETLGAENPDRGGEVLFSLAETTKTHQRAKQIFVRANVERRDRKPRLDMAEKFGFGSGPDEPTEQRDSPVVEATPLREQPPGETRAAIQLQPFEEFTVEQRQQSPRLIRRHLGEIHPGSTLYFERVDETVRKVEPNGVFVATDAPCADDPAHLAEAPAQITT